MRLPLNLILAAEHEYQVITRSDGPHSLIKPWCKTLPHLLTLSAHSTGLHRALQNQAGQLHAGAQKPSRMLGGDLAAAPADNDSRPYSTIALLAGPDCDTI